MGDLKAQIDPQGGPEVRWKKRSLSMMDIFHFGTYLELISGGLRVDEFG